MWKCHWIFQRPWRSPKDGDRWRVDFLLGQHLQIRFPLHMLIVYNQLLRLKLSDQSVSNVNQRKRQQVHNGVRGCTRLLRNCRFIVNYTEFEIAPHLWGIHAITAELMYRNTYGSTITTRPNWHGHKSEQVESWLIHSTTGKDPKLGLHLM